MFINNSRRNSLIGLGMAVSGGLLYIIEDITTSVSSDTLNLITQYVTLQYPSLRSTLIPLLKTMTTLGGVGVILGGIIAYAVSKKYGGYIIILSALGGILSYGTRLMTAYQAGVFEGSTSEIIIFFRGMGLGFIAIILSLLAYMRLR